MEKDSRHLIDLIKGHLKHHTITTKTLQECETYLKTHNDSKELRLNLAQGYIQLNQIDKPLEHLYKIAELDYKVDKKHDPKVWDKIGNLELKRNNYELALKAFSMAKYWSEPENKCIGIMGQAKVAAKQGDYQKAEALMREVITYPSAKATRSIFTFMANILRSQHKLNEAQDFLDLAADIPGPNLDTELKKTQQKLYDALSEVYWDIEGNSKAYPPAANRRL